jgi:MFS family permease
LDTRAAARHVGIATFVGGLGGGLAFPILPALGLQLGIPSLLIGLILSANRVSRLAFDAPAGKMVDRLGGRRPMTWGLCLEALGIAGYSAALHFGHVVLWFLAGRIVFGIGSAMLIVGAQATVLGLSSHENRGRLTATVRMALSMGMPGGLVLGGVIADMASDDAAFLVAAALTLAGAAIAWWLAPEARGERPPQRAEAEEGSATSTLGERFGALVALPQFSVLVAAWSFNALIFLCVQGILLATLVVLVDKRAVHLFGMGDQGTSGLIMAVLMASSTVMAFALGRGIDRLRRRAVLVLPSLIVLAAGFAVLAFARTLFGMLAGTVLVGSSFNGVTLPMLALLGDVTRQHHYGRAVGIYQVFGDVGGSLGPVAGIEAGVRFGLQATYLGVAVLVALGCFVALWVYRGERRLAHGPLPGP